MTRLNVACIQMRSTTSIEENIEVMDGFVRGAASDGANYVQTPEMTGLLQRSRKGLFEAIQSEENDKLLNHAAKLSAKLGIWLHIGSTAVKLEKELAANRAALFSPQGNCVATYDKIHMFDVDLDNGESWRESKVYRGGEVCRIVDVGIFKLGLSICYDLRFPNLYQLQAKAGAEILTAPAAFTRQTGQAHWHTLLRTRAIENGAYVIAAAQGGDHEDGRETFGHSMVVNPWGEVLMEIDGEEPGYGTIEIDLDEVLKARAKIPNLSNERPYKFEEVKVSGDEAAGEVA